jgi:hypothetical protein
VFVVVRERSVDVSHSEIEAVGDVGRGKPGFLDQHAYLSAPDPSPLDAGLPVKDVVDRHDTGGTLCHAHR